MYETFSAYVAQATSSDLFAGGLALGLIATLAALSRTLWRTLGVALWRRITISVTVDNRSPAFKFLCLWIEESDVLSRSRRMQVTQFAEDGEWRPAADSRVVMAPSEGKHWFFHEGAFCLLDRSIERKSRMESFSGQEGPLEAIELTLFGGGRKTVEAWIARGAELAAARDRIGPGIHTLGRHGWHSAGDVPRRAISSISTEDDAAERLLTDARWFYDSREWYAERGVPWRRGYLLYGPPGTGKSSLIRAVASELNCDIATLDLGRAGLSDDELREALSDAPKNAILACEDIDAVFAQREGKSGVSFSGLLNAIDGVAAQEGRALFMTTNHRERLDPALIRPGRADVHVELGLIGVEAAKVMFLRFFPEAIAEVDTFARNFGAMRVAPAALQGWLLKNHADAKAASGIEGLVTMPALQAAE